MKTNLLTTIDAIERLSDGAIVLFDLGNRDYQDYLIWLDAGNIPEPCDV